MTTIYNPAEVERLVLETVERSVADWLAMNCASTTTLAELQIAGVVMGRGIAARATKQLVATIIDPLAVAARTEIRWLQMTDDDRDVTLAEMLNAMNHLDDDATFRWFQDSYVSPDGSVQPGRLYRVSMGQARRDLGVVRRQRR